MLFIVYFSYIFSNYTFGLSFRNYFTWYLPTGSISNSNGWLSEAAWIFETTAIKTMAIKTPNIFEHIFFGLSIVKCALWEFRNVNVMLDWVEAIYLYQSIGYSHIPSASFFGKQIDHMQTISWFRVFSRQNVQQFKRNEWICTNKRR